MTTKNIIALVVVVIVVAAVSSIATYLIVKKIGPSITFSQELEQAKAAGTGWICSSCSPYYTPPRCPSAVCPSTGTGGGGGTTPPTIPQTTPKPKPQI